MFVVVVVVVVIVGVVVVVVVMVVVVVVMVVKRVTRQIELPSLSVKLLKHFVDWETAVGVSDSGRLRKWFSVPRGEMPAAVVRWLVYMR